MNNITKYFYCIMLPSYKINKTYKLKGLLSHPDESIYEINDVLLQPAVSMWYVKKLLKKYLVEL